MSSATTTIACGDNYIYLHQYDDGNAIVIDPSAASPVLRAIETRGLKLSEALATHHHFDHIGGIAELKKKTRCRLISPDSTRIKDTDRLVNDGDIIDLPNANIQVVATPGHTGTSVCYYIRPAENRSGMVFTGDTLFIAGCGRPFECDAGTMWASLQRIASLPDDTLVYPGHNYTEENYEFALTIEPENEAVRKILKAGNFTPPSSIAREKKTNVFLRANTPQIKTALAMPTASDAEAFAELRRRKNIFG